MNRSLDFVSFLDVQLTAEIEESLSECARLTFSSLKMSEH